MQLHYLMVVTALTFRAAALAADSTERTTPYDSNPACLERTTDSSTGNCVVKDPGTPRRTYPPKQPPPAVAPAPGAAPAAAPATLRRAPATGK